ncbi:MAG: hypothetical protein SF123_23055 [Chloroflexota bacterium]|nr:hypothetical protein [Chloroflexota bacterium]
MDRLILEDVMKFIKDYIDENNGLSPSIREIAAGCHINVSTASVYLNILEAQCRISRKPRTFRSIRIVAKDANSI